MHSLIWSFAVNACPEGTFSRGLAHTILSFQPKWLTFLRLYNPVIPRFLQYNFPSINLDTSLVANLDGGKKNLEPNGKLCIQDKTARTEV